MEDQSGNLTTHNATLKRFVMFAYQVREFQVIGGPSWIDSACFDILAKPPARKHTGAEFRQMVQALLADRFQLKVHQDSRELPIYALTLAKTGPKLTEWKEGVGPSCHYQGGVLTCRKVSMASLADELARRLGRQVVDRTGITGDFDVKLTWAPDEFQAPGPSEGARVEAANPGSPSLFNAVQEQLGLKLVADKAPVPVWVIDSAEKPSEN
jgi:uncharacterized protein (TIGR03435 family)